VSDQPAELTDEAPHRTTSYVSECEDCHFRMEWDSRETAEKRAESHADREGHETFTYTEVTYIAQ